MSLEDVEGRGSPVPRVLLPLLAGVLAAVLAAVFQRPGVVLSPDSWAYWESSISLMDGDDLTYFGGQPLRQWPPLFPLYLAGFQAIFGRTAGAIAVAQAIALGFAVALFAFCAFREFQGARKEGALAIALVLAVLLPTSLREILSESLFLAFFAGSCLVARRLAAAVAREAPLWIRLRTSVVLLGTLTGMVLSRHTGLAFLPAIVWLAARDGTTPIRVAAVWPVPAAALLGWTLNELATGGSFGPPHVPLDGAVWSVFVTTNAENLRGLTRCFVPSSALGIAFLAFAASIAFVRGVGSERVAAGESKPSGGSRIWLVAALLVALGVIFVSTLFGVEGRRFVLPAAALIPFAIAETGKGGRFFGRVALPLLVGLAAVQASRGAFWTHHGLVTRGSGIPWEASLVSACTPRGESCELPRGEIVPPDFPWIDRNWSAKHPDGRPSDGRP